MDLGPTYRRKTRRLWRMHAALRSASSYRMGQIPPRNALGSALHKRTLCYLAASALVAPRRVIPLTVRSTFREYTPAPIPEGQLTHHHYKLFKPDGFLTQFKFVGKRKQKQRCIADLDHDLPASTMAIGRLDEDTEGLLLLTTCGKLSNWVCSTSIEKEYWAQVDGTIDDAAITALCAGVEIGIRGDAGALPSAPYQTRPCEVCRVPTAAAEAAFAPRRKRVQASGPAEAARTSWVSIALREGKKNQVRKMTAAVGFPTLRLVRVRVGGVGLGDMVAGELRSLQEDELGQITAGK
jgi:23S rRNA pseudouridine2457 synthase